MCTKLDTIKTWVELGQGVVTTLAVLIAGSWAYWRFMRKREAVPKANIEHEVTFKRLSDTEVLLHVSVTMHNHGDVLLTWSKGLLRVQRVLPISPNELVWVTARLKQADSEQMEGDWPLLSEKVLTGQEQELEPGEADSTCIDFILDGDVECVLVYSYIENACKTGIGWNHTTIHDVGV